MQKEHQETAIQKALPPIADILTLEPEVLAYYLLVYLKTLGDQGVVRTNVATMTAVEQQFGLKNRDEIRELSRAIAEAWHWLETQGFVAPNPEYDGRSYVTRRGQKVADPGDLDEFRRRRLLLDCGTLHAQLQKSVVPLFIQGNYDTAVFQAYKEVEVAVRSKSGLPPALVGVDLMRKAFGTGPPVGLLRDPNAVAGEATAKMELYAGAIGLFKNPGSHRTVVLTAEAASEMIVAANLLLRLL